MSKSKYRTWDSPQFEEPVVDYGPSLTDPSQYEPIATLVDRHLRLGAPAHGLEYGEDQSRRDFTSMVNDAAASAALRDRQLAEEKLTAENLQKKLDADRKKVLAEVEAKLKAGSPELQALASELTRVLPGFEAVVKPDEGGLSKA